MQCDEQRGWLRHNKGAGATRIKCSTYRGMTFTAARSRLAQRTSANPTVTLTSKKCIIASPPSAIADASLIQVEGRPRRPDSPCTDTQDP